MKIRYNFELKSDKSSDFEPWLHEIFKNIEIQGINNFTVRVLKVKDNRRINYLFVNKKNKTQVIITKRKENILVYGYYKELPNIDYIKPIFKLTYEKIYNNTTDDKISLVTNMLIVLDKCNDYSENTVNKINVNCTSTELPNINLTGGIISNITFTKDSTTINTENKKSFCVLDKDINGNGLSIGKFLIFNQSNNTSSVFFTSEVSQYYNLITDKN